MSVNVCVCVCSGGVSEDEWVPAGQKLKRSDRVSSLRTSNEVRNLTIFGIS